MNKNRKYWSSWLIFPLDVLKSVSLDCAGMGCSVVEIISCGDVCLCSKIIELECTFCTLVEKVHPDVRCVFYTVQWQGVILWTDLVIRILSTEEHLYQPGHDFWKGPLSPPLIGAFFCVFLLMLWETWKDGPLQQLQIRCNSSTAGT